MRETDLVVIGGGIGGYVCAIRASQLGQRVILVEKARLGGECLIAGCIPSKSLISVAKIFDKVKEGARYGLHAEGLRVDFAELQSWKSGVVASLENGVAALCKGYRVDVIKGVAELSSKNTVEVTTADNQKETLSTRKIVIATGSSTISLRGSEIDGKQIIGSREALELKSLPERLLVIGGGYIGLEIASMYQRIGTKISIVELTDQLLPGTELDLVRFAQRSLERRGATIKLSSKVISIVRAGDAMKATVESAQAQRETLDADLVLVSVGRKPYTESLHLERVGVQLDPKGFIKTDNRMMTNVEGIYAIGDVRGPPLLAHKAQKEGIVAAESAAGLTTVAEWKTIPWAIFTDPEIAGVGMTEKQAVDAGLKVKRSRFSFAALGRAMAVGETEGFVRIISEEGTGVVLGAQIVGPEASDLISEVALAIEMGATVEDIALTIHPHPTLPEAIMEAAESASGKAVHQMRLS